MNVYNKEEKKLISLGPEIWWEKWQDPYEVHLPPPNSFDQSDTDLEEMDEESNIKYLLTPMGPIAITANMSMSKKFKLWIGYTNRPLTKDNVYLMENVNGVETLDIWTKYRFRVGIGKMFVDRIAMYQMKQIFRNFWTKDNAIKTNAISTQ